MAHSQERASQVALVVKNRLPMQETKEMQVQSLGWEASLEERMATHSSILDSVDRGAWWATTHRVSKSLTRLK